MWSRNVAHRDKGRALLDDPIEQDEIESQPNGVHHASSHVHLVIRAPTAAEALDRAYLEDALVQCPRHTDVA